MKVRVALSILLALALGQLPLASHGADTSPTVPQAIAHVMDYVRANPGEFGVEPADVRDLMVTDAYRSQHNGATHVYLRQRVRGIEVNGANATVTLDREGRVFHVGSRFEQGLLGAASGQVRRTPARALADAAASLELPVPEGTKLLRGPEGPRGDILLSPSGIALSPIPARLVYERTETGAVRLGWNFEIEETSQQHWWNVTVDAETGARLFLYDYVISENTEHTAQALARPDERGTTVAADSTGPGNDGASYRVYAWPFESPNDGDRSLVTNPADPLGSPFGWHDLNGVPGHESTLANGNNVHAYADWLNAGMGLPPLEADGGSSLTFDFPLDLSEPPHKYRDAAIANLFYWNNVTHDILYRYGFDEWAGNFQYNNYGRGGKQRDEVLAEAQDGSGVNNANFATPADGSSPRMQMYVWPKTNRRIIDGDFDAGVIIHEFGHGVSNRLTGGPNTASCVGGEERAGEGWSDFLGLVFTAMEGETGTTRRGMGTYVSGETKRSQSGIRPSPYSTKMTTNPATYDSIKTEAVPHGVGWVWASMLWDVFWNLSDDHGFNPNVYEDWTSGGNNLAIQLVMDGMKLQPCNPGFVDARDAIIAADGLLTGGENRCRLWSTFARRGLGKSAKQGLHSSRSDGTQAFDVPAGC